MTPEERAGEILQDVCEALGGVHPTAEALAVIAYALRHGCARRPENRPCAVCGRAMEVGPGAFTKAREYCSKACLQKQHRQRVKRAKELKAQGKELDAIASELRTTREAVTRWLVKRK